MCEVTLSDFEALDVRDAETVLIAGEIRESEKRIERLRVAIAPYTKKGAGVSQLNDILKAEIQLNKKRENVGPKTNGGRVIIH